MSPVDDNKKLLCMLRPYLISKRKQCDLVLNFLENRTSKHNRHRKTTAKDWQMMAQCQFLNKRGL